MTKQRIWIDMTDLASWSGHMTGIQRVMYQAAVRYIESPDYDAHFFRFEPHHNVFVAVDFAAIRAAIEAHGADVGMASEEPPSSQLSLTQLVRRLPRAAVRRIPPSVKQRIPPEVKQGIKGGARLSLQLARRAKHTLGTRLRPVAPEAVPDSIRFERQDIVLILGKSWDQPALIPTLGRLKQEQGFKLVHLIHDMIPTLEPHLFGPGLFEPYTRTMFEVCSLADGILTQSKATKKDVQRFCRDRLIPEPPTSVIRLGDDVSNLVLPDDEPAPDPRIKKGGFILTVGTIEVRKNHLLVYLAYREAALRGIDLPQWVIFGSQGWLVGDLLWQIEHDPLVKDKVFILRGLPDRARQWLYQHCRFTVVPATYEGWGLPIGESLAQGKVCITSRTSSMPEVGGDLADYTSPYNSQELLERMITYMDDRKLRTREQQIRKGYKLTSWDHTYEGIAAFVQKVAKQQ